MKSPEHGEMMVGPAKESLHSYDRQNGETTVGRNRIYEEVFTLREVITGRSSFSITRVRAIRCQLILMKRI